MFFGVAVVVVPYSFLSFIYFYVGDASSMGGKTFWVLGRVPKVLEISRRVSSSIASCTCQSHVSIRHPYYTNAENLLCLEMAPIRWNSAEAESILLLSLAQA